MALDRKFNVQVSVNCDSVYVSLKCLFSLPQLFKTHEEISSVEKKLKKEEMALSRHEEK